MLSKGNAEGAGALIDVIIPAAGMGRRLKSYGPKALIQVGGEPIIFRQIRLLRNLYPQARFIVVAGFEADRLKKALAREADVEVVVNPDYETTNVAKSVELGLRHSKQEGSLVVYGDLVFNREAVDNIPLDQSAIVVDSGVDRQTEVGVSVVNGYASHFAYGLTVKWSHIAMLMRREKELFIKASSAPYKTRYFGYEILNEVVRLGGKLIAVSPPGLRVVEVDTSKDIELARSIAS